MNKTIFGSSTFIESNGDQSFSNDNSKRKIVFEKGPPLHSCFDIYLKKNNTLLNKKSYPYSGPKFQSSIVSMKKPAFGCSQNRKSQSVVSKFNSILEPGPGTYNSDTSFVQNIAGRNSPVKRKCMPEQTQLGFNVCTDFKRITNMSPVIRKGPGPGDYEAKTYFENQKSKNAQISNKSPKSLIPLFHKNKTKYMGTSQKVKCQQNRKNDPFRQLSYIANNGHMPGPGAYNTDMVSTQEVKQQWRQKIKQRLNKKSLEQESIQSRRKFNALPYESMKNQNQIRSMGDSRTRVSDGKTSQLIKRALEANQKHQKDKQAISNPKKQLKRSELFRNELQKRTTKFLPNLQGKQNGKTQSSFITSLYSNDKFRPSNSFIQKNDHAFQAHLFVPKEREGEYLFFQGSLSSVKKPEKQSYMFTSVSNRTPLM